MNVLPTLYSSIYVKTNDFPDLKPEFHKLREFVPQYNVNTLPHLIQLYPYILGCVIWLSQLFNLRFLCLSKTLRT